MVVSILVCVCRKCQCCCSDLVIKLYDMVIFGMILKSIMTMFLPLMIRSGLGKNFCTSKCDQIDTNYYVIAVLTLYVCFVVIFSRFVHPATLAQEDMTKRMGALY